MPAPDLTNLEERLDREKRQREDELLIFLLTLFLRARSHADLALRLGASPLDAIRDVLMGNPALGLPGGAYRLATAMAEAEAAGFRRSLRVLNGQEQIIVQLEMKPNATHLSQARQYMARMLGTLQAKAYLALGAGGTAAQRKAVWEAFETWGYVDPAFNATGLVHSSTSKAWMLANVAETVIGFAYNGGWFNGFVTSPDAETRLKGWRFSATLDERTTEICRVRHGTKVLPASAWLQWNQPPLHFHCRSVLLPQFGNGFTPSETLPTDPPPMEGFGQAQAVTLNLVRAA